MVTVGCCMIGLCGHTTASRGVSTRSYYKRPCQETAALTIKGLLLSQEEQRITSPSGTPRLCSPPSLFQRHYNGSDHSVEQGGSMDVRASRSRVYQLGRPFEPMMRRTVLREVCGCSIFIPRYRPDTMVSKCRSRTRSSMLPLPRQMSSRDHYTASRSVSRASVSWREDLELSVLYLPPTAVDVKGYDSSMGFPPWANRPAHADVDVRLSGISSVNDPDSLCSSSSEYAKREGSLWSKPMSLNIWPIMNAQIPCGE